jgi:DeoR/GlpR family transcriptional regulator of sugar metabolism
MIARAAEAVIVADHSKFGQPSLAIFARWKDVDRLVTDHPPPDALARVMKRSSVEITVATVSKA